MISTNLHKPSSATHREVLVFTFIPVIQAELNEFMRTWNRRNVRKSAEAPRGVTEMLINVPAIVGFPKKVLIPVKEIYRLPRRQSILLNILLILLSYQFLIQQLTN